MSDREIDPQVLRQLLSPASGDAELTEPSRSEVEEVIRRVLSHPPATDDSMDGGNGEHEAPAYIMLDRLVLIPVPERDHHAPGAFAIEGTLVASACTSVAIIGLAGKCAKPLTADAILWQCVDGGSNASDPLDRSVDMPATAAAAGGRTVHDFSCSAPMPTTATARDGHEDRPPDRPSNEIDDLILIALGRSTPPGGTDSWQSLVADALAAWPGPGIEESLCEHPAMEAAVASWLLHLESRDWVVAPPERIRSELLNESIQSGDAICVVAAGDDDDALPTIMSRASVPSHAEANRATTSRTMWSETARPRPQRVPLRALAATIALTTVGAMLALLMLSDRGPRPAAAPSLTLAEIAGPATLRGPVPQDDDVVVDDMDRVVRLRVATDAPAWLQLVVIDASGERWIVPVEPYPANNASIDEQTGALRVEAHAAVDIAVPMQVEPGAPASIGALIIVRREDAGAWTFDQLLARIPDPVLTSPFTAESLDAAMHEHATSMSGTDGDAEWRRFKDSL